MSSEIAIIGVDCAAQAKNMGIAIGGMHDSGCVVTNVFKCARLTELVERIVSETTAYPRLLLVMDAPLGWPNGLAEALAGHVAGRPIGRDADLLFSRETDRAIRSRLGLKPLEVGADRIARVARTALELLEHLGSASGGEIPLLWDPATASRSGAIEVYPKATLKVHGLQFTGYKGSKPEQRTMRRDMVQRLGHLLSPRIDREEMVADDDLLDAAICVLAGHDFLSGKARAPEASAHCRTEGWIWVRDTA